MITILTLAAILKSGADGGLKMFAALGVLIGAIPTYLLTQKSNEQALARRDAEIRAGLAQVGELNAKLAEARNLHAVTLTCPTSNLTKIF